MSGITVLFSILIHRKLIKHPQSFRLDGTSKKPPFLAAKSGSQLFLTWSNLICSKTGLIHGRYKNNIGISFLSCLQHCRKTSCRCFTASVASLLTTVQVFISYLIIVSGFFSSRTWRKLLKELRWAKENQRESKLSNSKLLWVVELAIIMQGSTLKGVLASKCYSEKNIYRSVH